MLDYPDSLAFLTGRRRLIGACAALILVASAIVPVPAQQILTVRHPGGLMALQFENPMIATWVDTGDAPVQHLWQVPAGRIRLLTGPAPPTGGDPTFAGDENRAVAGVLEAVTGPDDYPYSRFTSKLTVAVGGTPATGNFHDIHALGEAAADVTGTDPVWNFWNVPPAVGSRDVFAIAQIPLDDADPNLATEFIEVEHHFTLIHDAVQLDYIVRNKATTPLPVGIRVLIDGRFAGGSERDGQEIYLPNGSAVNSEKVIPDADISVVPNTWITLDRPDNPTVYLRGTLDGSEVRSPGSANESGGKPDQIGWGLMRNLGANAQWTFTPNAVLGLDGEDWAYFAKWNEKDLAPGRSRRYVTYFGIGSSSADYDPPYALAAYSPSVLAITPGDDLATPEVEKFHLTDLQGRSPFPVYAYADNFYPSPLLDASVRISLPTGIELDPPTQPRSKSLGDVGRNELKSVSWTIRPTNTRPGIVIIRFTGPLGKTVERKINIPALPVLTPLPSLRGLEMVAIPYTFSDTDAEHVFQSLGSLHVGGPNALVRWAPDDLSYHWFPDSFVTNITPGLGYWLLNQNRTTIFFPDDTQAVPTDRAYTVNMLQGWSQIGNPFTGPVYLDDARVIDPTGAEWSMREAIDRGLLLATLFWYDAATNQYDWRTELANVRLDPYVGYWLLCFEDLTIQFPPPSLFVPASASEPAAPASAPSVNAWRVPLTIAGGGRIRSSRCFGVAPDASDAVDKHDVVAPPRCLPDGVSLTAELIAPGPSPTRFMQDIRQPAPSLQEWTLLVDTNVSDQPITVAWPDMSALPPELVATIVDETTGERRYMRTVQSYSYRSRDGGGPRALKIQVQPRPNDRALVVAANVTSTAAGAGIVYSLASDANVDIEIRNISGFPIRRVATNKQASAGVNTELWNRITARGAPAPDGAYLCRITARSPVTGEQNSMVTMFRLAR